MKLIGHELVAYEPLFWCESESEILTNHQNLFKFNAAMIKKAQNLDANFSVISDNASEWIVANAAGANFVIVPKSLASEAANLAEFYLFDAKIACVIGGENELEELAKFHADAAIFERAIVREIRT